jgi:hypothetical protein
MSYSEKELIRELKIHAKAVGIPSGAADDFIKRTAKAATKRLSKGDYPPATVRNVVAIELKKYSPDLAYAYKNHDKII